jgi:hypothetical protein
MSVPAPGVGVWSYRATVDQDDSFAAAISPVVGAKVDDIVVTFSKAAAAYARDQAHAQAVSEQARQAKASAERQTAAATAERQTAAATAEPGVFTGIWNSHGGRLDVKADGSVTLIYRIYVWCSDNPTPPCDQMEGNQIISGGRVTMHLVQVTTANGSPKATVIVDTSSDPKIPTGSSQTFQRNGGVITWTDTGQPFCDAKASQRSACGA